MHANLAAVHGVLCISPSVSGLGVAIPPPDLQVFPTDAIFSSLKFTDEEMEEWNELSDFKQRVQSTMVAPNGNQYHVHQELIIIIPRTVNDEQLGVQKLEGYICEKREKDLNSLSVPDHSVAKLDFGLMSWLDLPRTKLYPIKKLLISIHRPLAITLKLSWGGLGPDGMIVHAITFAHRGPETIMNILLSIDDDIIHCIDVQFIG